MLKCVRQGENHQKRKPDGEGKQGLLRSLVKKKVTTEENKNKGLVRQEKTENWCQLSQERMFQKEK